MGTMVIQVQSACTCTPAVSALTVKHGTVRGLTHAHKVQEITDGRMSEMEHVQPWEIQRQLSLRVIALHLPMCICLQCAEC